MVLETLFPVKKIIKHPIDMFIFSMVITFVSIYIANLIFPGPSTGKIVILFITMSVAPMIYMILEKEEESERKIAEQKRSEGFFQRYEDIIWLFTLFFLGVFIAIFVFSLLSPESYVEEVFEDQILEIERISTLSGSFASPDILELIVKNNLRVMGLSFFLSFLLGVGSIVILSWNASILALYLASFIRKGLFNEFVSRTITLVPHAPMEITSYFIAGIAGGILSMGIIKERPLSREFRLIFRDSLILMGMAVFLVFMSALLEVFV